MENIDLISLRNEIFEWARKHLIGMVAFNEAIPKPIEINKTGVKHTLWKRLTNPQDYKRNLALLQLTKQLVPLITDAQYLRFEKDEGNRDNIFGFHILHVNATFCGEVYKVKIVIRETRDKTFFYDHAIIINPDH